MLRSLGLGYWAPTVAALAVELRCNCNVAGLLRLIKAFDQGWSTMPRPQVFTGPKT